MRIKYAIKGLLKNKILTLILIIQFVLGFYALYNTLEVKSKVDAESSKIIQYFQDKSVYNLTYNSQGDIFDKKLYPKVNENSLKNTFSILQNSKDFTFTQQIAIPLLIKSFKGDADFEYYPVENNINGQHYIQCKNVDVDANAIKQFNIQLMQGRFFKGDENKPGYAGNHELPVIVGANYKRYYKVGDEISYLDPGTKPGTLVQAKAKIIGIMQPGQYLPINMMSMGFNQYMDLDNCIITTNAMFHSSKTLYETINGYNFLLFNKGIGTKQILDITSKIEQVFYENLGIQIDITSQNKYLTAQLDTYKEQEKIIGITAITIFAFITLTLILSMLNSINKRKQEFGIHVFSGGTLTDIAVITYMEVLLLMMFSFGVFFISAVKMNSSINLNDILILLLIIIIQSVVVTILPIMKIFRLEISNMIKGAE